MCEVYNLLGVALDSLFNLTTSEFERCIVDWVILIPDDLEVKARVKNSEED